MSVSQIEKAAKQKLTDFYAGFAEYASAPVEKWRITGTEIWREGATRVYSYGSGPKVLVLSPLINKPSILDDLMQRLAGSGFNALLVDWGEPGRDERNFDSAAYIKRVAKFYDNSMHLVGYCMGGIMALKLALLAQPRSLALLATPWDFGHMPKVPAGAAGSFEFVPKEVIASLFAYVEPFLVFDKFAALPHFSSEKKQEFYTIEHWVNDGVAMSAPLFKECLDEWVGKKQIADVGGLTAKTLLMAAMNDKIVPINSTLPLIGLLQNSELVKLGSGHIGIITKKMVHKPLVDWLKAN